MQAISQALSKLRVKSALNPVLWLCGIVLPLSMWLASTYGEGPPLWLLIMMFAPVGTAVVGFLFLLVVDREKLQSEDYQLRNRSLTMIAEKGYPIISESSLVELVVNPDDRQRQIEGDGE